MTLHGRDITVEVRSVNNRYLDCAVKLPRAYIFAEEAMKGLVQKRVSRGKVDVLVTVAALGAEGATVLSGLRHIDRGYEGLEGMLQALGARVERREE